MERYVVLEKEIGETPLSTAEQFRVTRPDLIGIPLSYAGRLDPMASGKLLILLGEECKKQTEYHDLDKEYEFSVLFGIGSDTGDVLGRLQATLGALFAEGFIGMAGEPVWETGARPFEEDSTDGRIYPKGVQPRYEEANSAPGVADRLTDIVDSLVGDLTFPYPLFSAKTVNGKPLHMWTLEGRLSEIEIPIRTSIIHELELTKIEQKPRQEIAASALQKINTIPEVTDPRKALGNDFRRKDVRADWQDVATDYSLPPTYTIAHFRCIASSGAYMRTLAELIAKEVGARGLAWHIHRTKVGQYNADKTGWKLEY